MTQIRRVAILTPLAVGASAVLCTIFIHVLAVGATVKFVRHEKRLGSRARASLFDLAIVVLAISFAFVAHLIEIALWARLFVVCGEFQEFGIAYYHSAVNYTTVGYGDVINVPVVEIAGTPGCSRWRAHVRGFDRNDFAVIVRLVQAKFEDLRN